MPQVHGHHHLAIQVKDLAAAERFYVQVLGLRVLRRWPFDDGRPGERSVWLSVGRGEEFLALAPQVPIRTEVSIYPLEGANRALDDLRAGRFRGAAVLSIAGDAS